MGGGLRIVGSTFVSTLPEKKKIALSIQATPTSTVSHQQGVSREGAL